MTRYVYILSEVGGERWTDGLGREQVTCDLYTVGFYRPDGKWEPESDHSDPEEAAKRVSYLNGDKCIRPLYCKGAK